MPKDIPANYLDLFKKKALAYLGTVMPNGAPQVTPVWIDYDGEHVLVNTAVGRLKDRNLSQRPQAAMTIQDPDQAYRYLAIQGRVAGVIEDAEGAREHINTLSHRYRGKDFVFSPGQLRRIYKISPEKVFADE